MLCSGSDCTNLQTSMREAHQKLFWNLGSTLVLFLKRQEQMDENFTVQVKGKEAVRWNFFNRRHQLCILLHPHMTRTTEFLFAWNDISTTMLIRWLEIASECWGVLKTTASGHTHRAPQRAAPWFQLFSAELSLWTNSARETVKLSREGEKNPQTSVCGTNCKMR